MSADDLIQDIADALDEYANQGTIAQSLLPLSDPGFDAALDRIRWRIGRTLGQSEPRFHACLRDRATQSLNDPDDALFYVLVSGPAKQVGRLLRDDTRVERVIDDLRRDRRIHANATIRFARYALTLETAMTLTPGQIGRMAQQFYDPTSAFGAFAPIHLPPSRGRGDIQVLVGHRRHGIRGERDWFDRMPGPDVHWAPEAGRLGQLQGDDLPQIQVKTSWSELTIALAVEIVRTAFLETSATLQWDLAQGRARLVGMTHPDAQNVEIVVIGTSEESERILVPNALIAHNRYRFDQALLEFAPLQVDGQTVC